MVIGLGVLQALPEFSTENLEFFCTNLHVLTAKENTFPGYVVFFFLNGLF